MKTYLYAWNEKSEGARALSEALGIKRIRHEGSKFNPTRKTIINWGSSTYKTNWLSVATIINPFARVAHVTNKWRFFQDCSVGNGPRIPRTTESMGIASTWNTKVVERHVLTGHSGNGIIIKEAGEPLSPAPLYVEYIPKDSEFRVHLMKIGGQTEIIDVQRKIRDPNREPTDWKVRSHANGFIFVRRGVNPPEDVLDQARLAYNVSCLDFGAVDVIFNQNRGRAYVLEINTAPGLEGETVQSYASGFRRMLGISA